MVSLEHISNILSKGYETGHEFLKIGYNKKSEFPEEFTWLSFAERITNNLYSINILIQKIENNPYVENAIGLILRSNLNDYLTIIYLTNILLENEDRFKKELIKYHKDNVYYLKRHATTAKEEGYLNESQYEELITNFTKNYKILLDKLNTVFTNLSNPRFKCEILPNHFDAYDLYIYFSKYEHFGFITYFMQRQKISSDFDSIKKGIRYSLVGLKIVIGNLLNKFYLDKIEQLIIELK